jgi:hypothetical protein
MSRALRAVEAGTKALVLGSLVLAVACESWLGRPLWGSLPAVVAASALLGLIGGRLAPWTTAAGILVFAYLAPVVVFCALGRYSNDSLLVWSAALTGLLVGDRDRWRWAYPSAWRFPLVLWATVVALAWPITALRESDFESLALLERYNIPNTATGSSPRLVIMWGADTAIIHLLGLLWFNWLFRHAAAPDDTRFERRVAWPLAAGAVAGALLSVYQGLFDLEFLSVGAWPSIRRAAGALLDANASGMVAAMWSAAFLALAPRSTGGRALSLAGAVVCWGGLWMSGSRTALVAAAIALAGAGLSVLGQARRSRAGLRALVAGGAAAATLAAVLLLLPTSVSPLHRLRDTLPPNPSRAALGDFAREMWNRGGYGQVATVLVREHPVTGVGIGLLNLTASARAHSAGRPLPPDNAQNWWRHHVAELGFLGAAGLLLWTAVFVVFLARTCGEGPRRVPAAALKGALVGLGAISLVGMPAQNLAVSMTFWALAFWYTRLTAPSSGAPAGGDRPWRWALILGWVGVYAAVMLVEARGAERPAMRAAVGQWRYTYGIYDPAPLAGDDQAVRWTERHGVAVVPNDARWMILTVRAQHPDLQARPVRAWVAVNGRSVVDRTLHLDVPLTSVIDTGPRGRAIIETRVDRTWRPAGLPPRHPDVGLSLSWRFSAERPQGLPKVTAPLRR